MDTNFLVWAVRQKANAFAEIRARLGKTEFVVPRQVQKELERLRTEGKTMEKWVRLAEEEMKTNDAQIVEVSAENADEALAKLSAEGCFVATNDRALRGRLGERIIFIRQNKLIEVSGV